MNTVYKQKNWIKYHIKLHYALKSVVKDIFNFPPMPFYDTLFKKDPLEGQ